MNFRAKLKILFSKDQQSLYTVQEFCHANKNMMVIVLDPKSERIFVSYKDRSANGKIKSATGKNMHVVRDVLKHSRFNQNIGDLTTAVMESIGVPLKIGNQFYQFLDGAIYNIAKSLRKKRENKPIPSPFIDNHINK